MAYKLLALDLDDTLLDAQKCVSNENKQAIANAKAAGIRVILASGRAYPGITAYNEELEINDYTIACGGAQVVDADGQVVFSTYVPPIATKQVMRWASLRNIHYQVYLDDGFHYVAPNQFSEMYETRCSYYGITTPDLLSMENILASKLLLIDSDENIEKYRTELKAMFSDLDIKKSQSNFLEVMNPEASKGTALDFIAKKLGIEQQQVIAAGDSEIDQSMIEYAGLGVAVANAVPCVLDAADYVTSANDENGIAKVIDKFILGGK
ncbi:MAG: Cof-type HAD-IIB family hydrolase [Christensenellaceae bacterium]